MWKIQKELFNERCEYFLRRKTRNHLTSQRHKKKIHIVEEVCRLILPVNAKVTDCLNLFEEFQRTLKHVASRLSERKKNGTEDNRVGRMTAGQSYG